MKFDDGTEVTADVKYAVLRSTDKQTFPNGPAYWEGLLDLPSGYKGPYKSPNMNTDSAIETPDKYTIVFHTKAPFAIRLPCPATQHDAGPQGQGHRRQVPELDRLHRSVQVEGLQPGKSFNLVRNDQWDPPADPIARRSLIASRSPSMSTPTTSTTGSSAATSTSTSRDWSPAGRTEPGPAGSDLKENADNPTARNWYTSINPTVAPLDNIECRKAIMYAMDHTGYQTAYGGQLPVGIWQRPSCRRAFRAIRLSTCTRTAQITRVTSRRPRSH